MFRQKLVKILLVSIREKVFRDNRNMMILVTGASRNVGTAVVSCLRTRQAPFRIGSRTAANSVVSQDDVDVVPFDFLNANTFRSADGLSKGQALPLLRDLSALMQFINV
jgi:uncharacterized protein YbjT (DUF2867 family)